MGVSVVALTGAGVALALERGGNLVLAGSLSCSSCTSTCSSACSWACSWSAVLPRNLQQSFVSISQTITNNKLFLYKNNEIGLHFALPNQILVESNNLKNTCSRFTSQIGQLVWLAKSSVSASCASYEIWFFQPKKVVADQKLTFCSIRLYKSMCIFNNTTKYQLFYQK